MTRNTNTNTNTNIERRTSNVEHRSEGKAAVPLHFNVQRSTFNVRRSRLSSGQGFTLVEVLATILLLAIILPVVDQGVAAATAAGSQARHRTEASGLAQGKLAELTIGVPPVWANGAAMAGDFGNDWPGYRWQATVSPWANDTQAVGLQQLDVQVFWKARGREESVTLSSLVYVRPTPTS